MSSSVTFTAWCHWTMTVKSSCVCVITVSCQVNERVEPRGAWEPAASADGEFDTETDGARVSEHREELAHHADGTTRGTMSGMMLKQMKQTHGKLFWRKKSQNILALKSLQNSPAEKMSTKYLGSKNEHDIPSIKKTQNVSTLAGRILQNEMTSLSCSLNITKLLISTVWSCNVMTPAIR